MSRGLLVMFLRKSTIKVATLLAALVAMLAGTGLAQAGKFGKGAVEGPLRLRYFTAEIPPAPDGGKVRVGVKLPLGAKIAKTEVFIDTEDKGERKDWAKCDIEKKTCDIGDSSIVAFHRENRDEWQDLAVDVRSDAGEPRYAKISVLFQPQSGFDNSGCNRNNLRCGYMAAAE
ncbi:MAG: hypothetical protein AMJ59_17865 [Gammaproteobacteria bacterium SG8_31]|nr:MAG: hypothetical protein AMJ59_17865 [Gammaproteobacteria bacterium SG8_31]